MKSSHLVILEEGEAVLRVRTRMVSWWMGGVGMAFLLAVAAQGLYRLGEEALAGRWLVAGAVLLGYGLGVAFTALFANGLTHQRLGIKDGVLTYAWRLGALPLKHRGASVESIKEVTCEVVRNKESSDVHYLEIEGPGWRERFGSETSDITLREILARLQVLGVRTNPGPLNGGVVENFRPI